MSSLPWFRIHVEWLERASVKLDVAALGLLVRCMSAQWRYGVVPDDLAAVSRATGATPTECSDLWPRIADLFVRRNGGFVLVWLDDERRRVEADIETRRRNGQGGGRKPRTSREPAATPSGSVSATDREPVGQPAADRLPDEREDLDPRDREKTRARRAPLPSCVAKGWLAQVVGKALVTDADVDAFGRHVAAHVARNGYALAPGTHAFRWLDDRLAEFVQERRERTASDASAKATEAFIRHHEAIAASIPKRTPEEVRALLGRPPGRGAEEASA